MDHPHTSTQMISSDTDVIRHIFGGIMKQIQEELSSLDSSLPSGSSTKLLKGASPSVSSHASVKSTDLLTKNDNDDLKKTLGQILHKFHDVKDQKQGVSNLSKDLSDAICKHMQVKCQGEIKKLNEYTTSQVENILSSSILGSSGLQGASSILKSASAVLQGSSSSSGPESLLNQLVTFGKKVKKLTSSDGQSPINSTLKKLAAQPLMTGANMAVSKLTGKELPKDLSKLFQDITDGNSDASGSMDLMNFQNRIVEKVVSTMVSKMLMEKFNLPKSAFKEEHQSDQESHRLLPPPLKMAQDLIVEKITDSLFLTQSAAGGSASKDLNRKPSTKVKEMIQDYALQAVKKAFTK